MDTSDFQIEFLNKAQSISKLRNHLSSESYVFPVVMYGCESWTIRKLSTDELMLLNCGVGEDS